MSVPETLIYSESALKIVTDPFIVGDELLHLSKESSKDFCQWLYQNYLRDSSKLNGPFTCLNILRGGRYYGLIDAWDDIIIQNKNKNIQLQLSEIRAARYVNEDTHEWYAKVWHDHTVSNISDHESEHNLLNASTIIIGDTIATGSTLIYVLKYYLDLRKKNKINHKKVHIILWSICGSSVAKYKLYQFYKEELLPNNISLEIVLANGGYVLNEENGTDLSLITDDMIPSAKKYIEDKVGLSFLKYMKCAIWDWGDRFNGIDSHLHEIIEYFSEFYIYDLPQYIRESLIRFKNKPIHSKL